MKQHCTPEQIETIINHHQAQGARPASFRLSCIVADALKKSRLLQAVKDAAKYAEIKPSSLTVPCPYSEIVKNSHLSAIINFNYEGNVNKQREREGVEGAFKAKENWFVHVSPAIVAHRSTGEHYVFIRVQDTLSKAVFIADGKEVSRASLLPFLPSDELTDEERAAYGLAPSTAGDNQGVAKVIAPIAVKLANVRQITVDGFTYVTTGDIAPATISRTRRAYRDPRELSDAELYAGGGHYDHHQS